MRPFVRNGKSSTIRNPPFCKYARRFVTSLSDMYQKPGSTRYATGNLNSSGSLKCMMLLASTCASTLEMLVRILRKCSSPTG